MRSHFRFALVSTIFLLGAAGPIASAFAQSQIDQSEEQLKIHELQHISAAEAAIMLQKLFPAEFKEGSKLVADERSNSLTIRAPASVQRSIATFLSNSDRPDSKRPPSASSAKEDAGAPESTSNRSNKPGQKNASADEDDHLEFKIFHLQNASAPQAAVMLPDVFPEEFRHGEAKVTSDERTNSLILRAPASVLATVEALLLNLDQTDSKRPQVAGSTQDVGGGITGPLTSLAAKLRRNNTPAAIGSPEFQRYEQEAQAAAQAYRQQLAATPKDDARLGQLKADLQGAVHTAFHARQAWQRGQVAEMRKRLDEIEKNITARSQRVNEIIEHRVDDLLNPERQWESEAASSDQDAATTSKTTKDRLDNSDDLNAFPPTAASSPRQPEWLTDEAIAAAKSATSNRPIAYYLYQSGKPEADVLHSVEMRKALNAFVAVKLSADSNASLRILNSNLAADIPREFPMMLVVTKDFGTFGPYHDFSKNGGKDILDNLYEIKQLALRKRQDSQGDKPEIAGKGGGDSSAIPPTESGARDTAARTSDSGVDPRKELLIAENAVNSAKAAMDETVVDIDAADAILTRIVTAHKTGGVPEKVLLEAQAEVKRKAAALNRMRADLQGKERVLALAKEHLEGEINFAELQVQQAKAEFEDVARQENRARQLFQNKSISSGEYEKALTASRQAQISLDRATAKYELYRKALPGQSGPASNPAKEGQTDVEKPANPTKPGENRE